jgi:hypothetical protein
VRISQSAFVGDETYFDLHGPRQPGKITAILSAVNSINEEGSYYAINCSLEQLQGILDVTRGNKLLASLLNGALYDSGSLALKSAASEAFFAELDIIRE